MTISGCSGVAEKSVNSVSSNSEIGAAIAKKSLPKVVSARKVEYLMNDSIEVAHDLEKNNAKVEAQSRAVQKISADVVGRKTQFTVVKDLGLIVEIVDPSTDKVIKEIPSRESLILKERMERTAGLIFHKTV